VTQEDEWEATIQRILAASGRLDILVNSAGISHAAALSDMTLADWRRVFAVNLDAIFLGTKHALRAMTPVGSGRIVNVASASGIRAASGASAYSTSKAAVGMFTCAAAKECRDRGLRITINAVAPAAVRTPMSRKRAATAAVIRQLVVGRDTAGNEVGSHTLLLSSR